MRFTLTAMLGAVLCVCSGCAAVDLDLAISRGQARWYAATGLRPVPLSVSWTADRTCGNSTQAVGCADLTGNVWIWHGVREQAQADRIMLHELGHVLSPGRGHVGAWEGIMAPDTERGASHITQHDLDMVCLGFLCPWERPERR